MAFQPAIIPYSARLSLAGLFMEIFRPEKGTAFPHCGCGIAAL